MLSSRTRPIRRPGGGTFAPRCREPVGRYRHPRFGAFYRRLFQRASARPRPVTATAPARSQFCSTMLWRHGMDLWSIRGLVLRDALPDASGSTICIGVPRHSALFFQPLEPKVVAAVSLGIVSPAVSLPDLGVQPTSTSDRGRRPVAGLPRAEHVRSPASQAELFQGRHPDWGGTSKCSAS